MKASESFRFMILSALMTVAQAACSNSLPAPTPTAVPPTRHIFTSGDMEETDCRFVIQFGSVAECGDLQVPEDYNQPQGKTIRLHVAIFRSPSDHVEPDPVIYLHGGPGGGAGDGVAVMAAALNRDVIIFDQRGTAHSEPRLDCPSLAESYMQSLAEDQPISLSGWEADHLDACKADLEKRGINLAAYTVQANAADLDILIKALGYRHVNLFAQSYGTYLALTYMREYGNEGFVRSAVLDGVNPPQVDISIDRGRNAEAAWKAIFSACAADPACNKAYPDLEKEFYELLERLAAQPVVVQKMNPLTGQSQTVIVNDFRFLEALYRSSYLTGWISKIPRLIASLNQGDVSLLDKALSNVFESATSVDQGVYYAIRCSDEIGFASSDAIRAANAPLSTRVKEYFNDLALRVFAACQKWPAASPSPTKHQPAFSDIPTLLLSGAFDPATAPPWARLASETLSQGYLYEFPAEAHDLLWSNSCAQTIFYGFVNDPVKPSARCLDDLSGPTFELP